MLKRRAGLVVWAVGATAALGATAAIADGPYRGGYAAPYGGYSWTGFYIGGNIGGAWAHSSWDESLTVEHITNDPSGVIGGVQAGYNWQAGNVVIGIEASYSAADLSNTFTSVFPGITFRSEINNIVTVTGRLGYAANRWLYYAKAGWASAEVELSGNNPALPDAFSLNDRRDGWTVGGGVAYKFASNMSFGVEYNFIDFGKDSDTGATRIGLPFTLPNVKTDISSVTARLDFSFYRDEPRAVPLK